MISIFAAVLFIETVQGNTSLSGIATYRHEYDEFVYYKFKAFVFVNNQHMINKIERNKIMLLIGRFVLENSELNRGYNPITSNYLMIEIDCTFDAGTARYAGVPNVIENKAILSVCSELYKGNNMMHIIASDIEWNNVFSVNKASTPEQVTNNRKKCNQDLLNFENKYKNKKIDKKPEQTPMAESATTNNKLNCKDPIDRSNNKSEDKIENKSNSEYDKQQDKTEKNNNSRADKLKSALRNAKK
ncbi:28732_t:CDS:2 [Gigaspora margarita]|uniref:28732_t:CDS:1 n=1 Tax=Gigaspora margarita TaxID=4874 RepID=A0ABN7UF16_GIGMA|nr:28732_t:CDS:2 [Gigaspora margarita]